MAFVDKRDIIPRLQSALFRRKVPTYNRHNKFELIGVSLGFRSERPSSNYLKEFYEENLCYLLPCCEIEYHLRKSI